MFMFFSWRNALNFTILWMEKGLWEPKCTISVKVMFQKKKSSGFNKSALSQRQWQWTKDKLTEAANALAIWDIDVERTESEIEHGDRQSMMMTHCNKVVFKMLKANNNDLSLMGDINKGNVKLSGQWQSKIWLDYYRNTQGKQQTVHKKFQG